MEAQKIQNSQSNPDQKKQCCKYHNTLISNYARATVTKPAWYWPKNNTQTNGIEQNIQK
jgi:hypothetical protein